MKTILEQTTGALFVLDHVVSVPVFLLLLLFNQMQHGRLALVIQEELLL